MAAQSQLRGIPGHSLQNKKGPDAFRISGPQTKVITTSAYCFNNSAYLPGQVQHVGIGPLFSFTLTGAAAAKVQVTATTRSKLLTARLISISYMRVPWERKP